MAHAHPVIAICDDEEHFRKALTRLLKASGYEVESFAAGVDLLARAARHAFGCVLLDLNMPGVTGLDVLTELHRRVKSPPVIVLSSSDDPATIRRAFALSAFDYQLKPVAATALLGAIERALHA